jgi:hypothetical protein
MVIGEREAMRVETATRFLTSVVDEEGCTSEWAWSARPCQS